MTLDLLSVFVGALITGIASFIGVKYQVDNMAKVEVAKLKWDRYADKLLELGEYVSKTSVLIPMHIEKAIGDIHDSEQYINDNEKIWGSSIRWSHYKDLSNLLKEYEDYSFDAVLLSGHLKDEQKENIVQNISGLATEIQKEIDKILQI